MPTGSRNLVKVTVNLTDRAFTAVEAASARSGDNRTDVINRAVLLYAVLEKETSAGATICLMHPDGRGEKVHIL